MTQPFRMPTGGRVDRSRPISFTFDRKRLQGLKGDTLASALLANGIHLVGRSFKYHRPRGVMTVGSDEPNALVRVGQHPSLQTPNTRATEIELHDGLEVLSQNRWPSLRHDLGAVFDLLSPLVPAGFYYKTFMWPKRAWDQLYEPAIRAVAGLGRAPTAPDTSRYTQRFAHCDVLVIGAGPAGLSAASAAAECGARVILCDEQFEFGGSLLAEPDASVMGQDAWAWVHEAVSRLAAREIRDVVTADHRFRLLPRQYGRTRRMRDRVRSDQAPRTVVARQGSRSRIRDRSNRAATGFSRQ